MEDMQLQLQETLNAKQQVELQAKEREESRKKLQSELSQALNALEKEKQGGQSTSKSLNSLERELRTLHRMLEEDLSKSIEPGSLALDVDEIMRGLPLIDNLEEVRKNYEKQLRQLNLTLGEEVSRRFENLRSLMFSDPIKPGNIEEVLKELRGIKNKFEYERNVHKKKLRIEAEARLLTERAFKVKSFTCVETQFKNCLKNGN
jgi:hypothetical protein